MAEMIQIASTTLMATITFIAVISCVLAPIALEHAQAIDGTDEA